MADKAHADKLKEGEKAWNAWRRDKPDVVPDLSGCDFRGMGLSGFDFSDTDFGDTNVTDADFRQANLRGAKLGSVIGLLPESLAGADLPGAKLPKELSEFPALAHVAEVSKHARTNFLAVVASCVFCWLTIAQTSDGALIANRGAMPLPVINTKVPVTGFFLFAPAILLALYVYLQLYLQRMWDALSRLPAVFPDGARLDEKAFPWLLSGLISLYVPKLRKGAPPFAWLQIVLSVVAAWLLVPATIAWFWLRYLLVTDALRIAPHVFLLALAIAFGVLFYRRAHVTLRGRTPQPDPASFAGRLPAPGIVAPLLVFAVSLGATAAVTYGLRLSTDHWHLDFTGEVITGSPDLKPELIKNLQTDAIKKLKLLDLKHVSFRHAEGREATLIRVNLTKVDLSFARFDAADLRGAVLLGANLTGARLVGANLEGANLTKVRLDGADLSRALSLTQNMLDTACGVGVKLRLDLSVDPCDLPEVRVASAGGEDPRPEEPGKSGAPTASTGTEDSRQESAGKSDAAEAERNAEEKRKRTEAEAARKAEKERQRAATEAKRQAAEARQRAQAEAERQVKEEPQIAVSVDVMQPGEIFRDCADCPEMVVIPAGEFVMGSPEDEEGRFADEGPQHGVRIAAQFAVGRFEVTRDQFDAFVRANGRSVASTCWTREDRKLEKRSGRSYRSPGFSQSGDHPVVCMSWENAQAYVAWLSEKTGQRYRLLSEAEWEYVARAGTDTRYSFGDNITKEDANFDFSKGKTTEVGSYPSNPWKLHDMHGNVWEWVEDCWNDGYGSAPSDGSVWPSAGCDRHVLRGGSWGSGPGYLRSANRNRHTSGYRNFYLGFRVARELTP